MTREKMCHWTSWLWQTFPHFLSSEKCRTKLRTEETLDFMARAGHGYGLNDIVAYPRNLLMISAAVDCISEVFSLVKLLLVLPATNAVSERSASALRRLRRRRNWAWQILKISLFQRQVTGKIPFENSMSFKTFSNHVLNAKTNWQLIIFYESVQVWQDFLLRKNNVILAFAKF